MLRTKPRLAYSGLTVVLSNQSRFDAANRQAPDTGRDFLLTATGGQLFNDWCLRPEYNQMQCDIRVMEDTSPWLVGTKAILLCGEAAMHKYCPDTVNNTLNEMRGSPLDIGGIPAIASYLPQDASDSKAYEQKLNPLSKDYSVDDGPEDEDSEEGDEKSHSSTKRRNYAFWLRRDTWKIKQCLLGRRPTVRQPTYKIYPTADEVISILQKTKDQWMDFDIETDYEDANLLCFSFSFDGETIYCVPVLNTDYQWAYSSLHYILRALFIAVRDNILVAHNGAAFDFHVLGMKYHLPINRTYDTMLAMHRCFPDVEKSLGHCTSYWTWEQFHKDTDSVAYRTREHMNSKLLYCGKDVYTMSLIRTAIQQYAKTIPGLQASIDCAMASIRPYVICTLQGIRYSQEALEETKKENDRLMMQYLRILRVLIGDIGTNACRQSVKGKAKAFPGSNTQCCNYFHEQLGYPVVARSLKTQKPSLGKKALFKLALQQADPITHEPNPVITYTILYRIVQKEYSSLKFIPWKDDNNKIVDRSAFEASVEEGKQYPNNGCGMAIPQSILPLVGG